MMSLLLSDFSISELWFKQITGNISKVIIEIIFIDIQLHNVQGLVTDVSLR